MSTNNRKVLITGVAGFIGRYVARYFSEQGWFVIGTDNSPPENAPTANLSTYYQIQLPNKALDNILKEQQPFTLIHCAGRASVGLSISDPSSDFYTNTTLTFELLNTIRLYTPQCRFILLSSAAVYGNPLSLPVDETQPVLPISPYGFHKWQSEQLCQEFSKIYNISTASVRIFSAYGPGLRRQVLWDICYKIITHNSLELQGSGKESRDFVHALDIARALMVISLSAPLHGEAYNLGSGRETTISQLSTMILNTLDTNLSPAFDGIVPPGTPLNWCADISKLMALGFKPQVAFDHAVKTYANWCYAELVGV